MSNRISAIIPVYNGAAYLAEAIQSILEQKPAPSEVVVVDDGSTDDTQRVAASFGEVIHYDRQPHRGVSETLNRGVLLSKGDLLAFLDADDIWLPGKNEKQLSVLQNLPDIDMVFGHSLFFISPEMDENAARSLKIPETPQPAIIKSSMLIRRSSFFKAGLFDPSWQVGDFVDWYAKSMEAGLKAHMLPSVIYKRRIHGRNMTLLERSSQRDYVRILKASLDRRRSASGIAFN